jgi:hypothetical protein
MHTYVFQSYTSNPTVIFDAKAVLDSIVSTFHRCSVLLLSLDHYYTCTACIKSLPTLCSSMKRCMIKEIVTLDSSMLAGNN